MHTSTDRQHFRETVAVVAAKARGKLPASVNGRIESAARLVVSGDVEPLEDGTIKVNGSDPTRWYHLVGTACTCTDFVQGKAPEGWCKHRIAAGIHKRVHEMLPPAPGEEDQQAAPILPSGLDPRFVVELHGKQFVTYPGLLALATERGLVSLKARFLSVTPELALAEADATFADGRTFSEAADATPGNVGAQVRPHFARLALTRAKARVLRDALNIGLCSLEELD